MKHLSLLTLAVAFSVPSLATADTVSTAYGNGTDVQVTETSSTLGSVGNSSQLNTRANPNAATPSVNDVVGLRFDLSAYPSLSAIQNVSLNFINYRTNTARTIDIYGVKQGTVSGSGNFTTETWSDTTVSQFGDVPGLQVSDMSFATLSLDTANLTLLVDDFVISSFAEGTAETATSSALDSFIQNYTGSSMITFIITQGGAGSTGQFRFASKEATGLTTSGLFTGPAGTFAPYLSFTVGAVPEPTTLSLLGLGGLALLIRRRRA